MDNSCCSRCFSFGAIDLTCGHKQCNLCSQVLNEANIQCYYCSFILPISNDDAGIVSIRKCCIDCGIDFNSNSEYGKHKKKVSCSLLNYGCLEETDICSMNKHLSGEVHKKALKLCFIQSLESLNNVNFLRKITECLAENNKISENEEINSINDKLVLDFANLSTIREIEDDDKNELTNEERENLFDHQLNRGEQIVNLIHNRINQLDPQEQITISNIQNQFQIDQSIEEEFNTNELLENLNKLQSELKQIKETNRELVAINEFLITQINTYRINLSSTPVSRNGLLIWKIDKISEKITQSYIHPDRPINSPRFLTLTGEHSLNVQLYLYGYLTDYPQYITIIVKLSSIGNNQLSIPLTCCLVDQTDNHQHILERTQVNLNQNNIGTICQFYQFVQSIHIHKKDSQFVKDDIIYLIIKLHEDQSNQYNHYSSSIRHALQQIGL